MTARTFQQFAQGCGSAQANIVVTIGGTEIYNGPVQTVDEPIPQIDDVTNLAFTWTEDVAYQGTKTISISVMGSTVVLGNRWANYSTYPGVNGLLQNSYLPWTESGFGGFFIDPAEYSDPYTNVSIDGVLQPENRDMTSPSLDGLWRWIIPAGSTWTATLNVTSGREALPYDPTVLYQINDIVVDNGTYYLASANTNPPRTAGIPLSSSQYWAQLPIAPVNTGQTYSKHQYVYDLVTGNVYQVAQTPTPGNTPFTDASYWTLQPSPPG